MKWKSLFAVLLGLLMVGVTAGSAAATTLVAPTSSWPGIVSSGTSSNPQHTSTLVAKGRGSMEGGTYNASLSVTLGSWDGIWDPRIGMWRYDYIIAGAASARSNNNDFLYKKGDPVPLIMEDVVTIKRENSEIHFLYNPNDPMFTAVYPSTSGPHDSYKSAVSLFQLTLDAMEVDSGISFIMDTYSLVDALLSNYQGDKNPNEITYDWNWHYGGPRIGVPDEAHYIRFLLYVEPGVHSYKRFTVNDYIIGAGELYDSVPWYISVETAPTPSTLTPQELSKYHIVKIAPRYLIQLKAQGIFKDSPKNINSLVSYLIKKGKPLYIITNSVHIDRVNTS